MPGSQPHNTTTTRNRALQSLIFLDRTSHKVSCILAHTSNTTTADVRSSCSSCQRKASPVRQASRRETRSVPHQRSQDDQNSHWHYYMLFDESRSRVGEGGCMVAADVKSKNPGAAPSLRCEIECFQTGRCLPGPRIDPHGRVYLGEHRLSTLSCSTRLIIRSIPKVAQLSQTVSLRSKRWEKESCHHQIDSCMRNTA